MKNAVHGNVRIMRHEGDGMIFVVNVFENGYTTEASINMKPDTVYKVSKESQELFRTVVKQHEDKNK
jgi:hypothetical protein